MLQIVRADLSHHRDAAALVELLDLYARDAMGGGEPLTEEVRRELPGRLASIPHARVFLAWEAERALGVCVCFECFSTFLARPLWNIHDVAVRPDCRGQGVGKALLDAVEVAARAANVCKLTLEVRDDNPARRLYLRQGFDPGQSGSTAMSFYTKLLS